MKSFIILFVLLNFQISLNGQTGYFGAKNFLQFQLEIKPPILRNQLIKTSEIRRSSQTILTSGKIKIAPSILFQRAINRKFMVGVRFRYMYEVIRFGEETYIHDSQNFSYYNFNYEFSNFVMRGYSIIPQFSIRTRSGNNVALNTIHTFGIGLTSLKHSPNDTLYYKYENSSQQIEQPFSIPANYVYKELNFIYNLTGRIPLSKKLIFTSGLTISFNKSFKFLNQEEFPLSDYESDVKDMLNAKNGRNRRLDVFQPTIGLIYAF